MQPADLVLTHAAIHADGRVVGALAVRDGVIVALGADVDALIGPATEVRDLGGATVLPGFVDAHVHLLDGGLEALGCSLVDLPDPDVIVARVHACAAEADGKGWLVGSGWDLGAFPGANPQASVLDDLGRPVFLLSADGHSAWLDHEGLRRAGITANTPDPADGRIERDELGEPTGTLRESAVDLAWDVLPAPTRAERDAGLRAAVAEALAHGITAVFEAEADRASLATFRRAARRGELDLTVSFGLTTDPEGGPGQVERLVRWRRRFSGDDRIVGTAKIFADGVIEARTAALLAPYADSEDRGAPIWDDDALDALVAALTEAGFAVHAHTIGDAAVRQVLDAGERAGARLSLAHLELVDPDDVPRFAALGADAVFQPLWAQEDDYVRDLTWPVLDADRGARLYPIGSLVAAGAPLAFGSDWSVSSLDPLQGIEVAVTRRGAGGEEAPALEPEQAIDVATAIDAYTVGAARAAGLSDRAGRIAVRRPADLVVLDGDPYAVPADAIGELRPVLVLRHGRPVAPAP
ncbi:MAG: amidohydrolase [Alphaproteobacteria bacterium]|nr:amidohydrolase [Alphaproteobacteria bacterium]